jgi:uncharacterized protein (TIGR02466 family)
MGLARAATRPILATAPLAWTFGGGSLSMTAQPAFRWQVPEAAGSPPFLKFLPLMRAAVEAAPHRTDLKMQLARALFHIKRDAEIVDRLGPHVDEGNVDPELSCYVGRAALATGDHQLACGALSIAAGKGFAPAFGYLAEALEQAGRHNEAVDAALRRLHDEPSDFTALRVAARVLLGREEAERLWSLCVELRARGASGAWFSAVAAAAAATLGMEDEFKALIDPARWFAATQLSVPDGFNQRLGAELLALRSSAAEMRIDRLEALGGPFAHELNRKIRTAVEAYVADRDALRAHAMIAGRPARVALHSWALFTQGGKHHGWHIHRAGWISGVYYVAVPEIEPSCTGHPGAIEFGPYPFDSAGEDFHDRRWQVMPRPGLLLLFPSYYGHRTRPTGVTDLRISVAFDVRPSVIRRGAQ